MEMRFDDFIAFKKGLLSPTHIEEMEKLILQIRRSGQDVWLLDQNGQRIAIIVLSSDGRFTEQMIK